MSSSRDAEAGTSSDGELVIPDDMIFGPDGEPDWDTYYEVLFHTFDANAEPMPESLAKRHPGTASVVGAIGLGLQQVFEPHKVKQEMVVQRDDSGDPDDPDKALHLDFDPDDPRQTRAIVRPHNRG